MAEESGSRIRNDSFLIATSQRNPANLGQIGFLSVVQVAVVGFLWPETAAFRDLGWIAAFEIGAPDLKHSAAVRAEVYPPAIA
jgi:hypothetical protein